LSHKRQYFADFFGENILKIIKSTLGSDWWSPFSVHAPQQPKKATTRMTQPMMMKMIEEFR
jgi:hypothetical protein